MAVIALPAAGIRSVAWTQPPRAAWASKSIYSNKQTIIDRGTVTEGWRAAVTVAPRNEADVLAWRAWQAQMLGPVNTTYLAATESAQIAAGGGFAIVTAPTANSFTASGLLPGQAPLLRAGSLMTFSTVAGFRLATLTADMNTDGSGVSNAVTYEPPLYLTGGVGSVILQQAFAEMRLAGEIDLGWEVSPGNIYQPKSFELEEAL